MKNQVYPIVFEFQINSFIFQNPYEFFQFRFIYLEYVFVAKFHINLKKFSDYFTKSLDSCSLGKSLKTEIWKSSENS